MAATLGVTVAGYGPPGPAAAESSGGVITSDGPLTYIRTTADLNCDVRHTGDTSPEFYGSTACGTLVAVSGVLYGPASIPAGGNATPRTAWSPVSQDSSGSGTTADPYRVVTVVQGGPLVLTQIDLYVTGAEYYSTRVDVENTDSQAHEVTVYRAGDCYLQDSDWGYGASDPAAGSVACTAGSAEGARIEQWAPITPGSHYLEAEYTSVWDRIGAQLPFPDTSMDDTYQDNGAGLSWTETIGATSLASFAHLTAFSPTGAQISDTDGDSFPDTWEQADGGVDTDGDGTPDLKLSDYGATPDRPDVFVEVGWSQIRSCTLWVFRCSTTTLRPSLAALADVQHAFAGHGVRLHIDAGRDSLMNPDTGATWGSRSQVSAGVDAPFTIPGAGNRDFDWTAAFDTYRSQLLTPERRRLFHFALYAGKFNGGSSGISRGTSLFAGRDFIIAAGVINDGNPTRLQESGTFMHELGHNLGLSHGGSVTNMVNWKPNFPSVMNYMWQMNGVPKNDSLALLDYSEGTLSPIDENALIESPGLDPDQAASNIGTNWVCPGTNHLRASVVPAVRDLDWNCDGSISSTPKALNLNGMPSDRGGDQALTAMTDNNDWGSLIFDGGGALGASGDTLSAPAVTDDDEVPAAVLTEAAVDHHPVTVDGVPGQLAMHSATTAPLEVTVTNHRDAQVTYHLTSSANGVSLAGIPGSVTLAAGASHTFTLLVTTGAATDDAFFEIDADSGEVANTASAVAEVYVTDATVADQPPVTQPPAAQPPVTQPPAAQPPAATPAPASSVAVKAVRNGNKLRVDVNPNKGKGYWKFSVYKLGTDGVTWVKGKTYRTQGKAETRTLNLKKGSYKVVVAAKYRLGASESTVVALRR